MPGTEELAVIGITPPIERSRRARLLYAFEQAYPVRFEGRAAGQVGGLDGLICFESTDEEPELPGQLPSLRFRGEESAPGLLRTVSLARHTSLARPLWGSQLTEAHASDVLAEDLEPGEVPLATIGRAVVWRLRTEGGAPHHTVSLAPLELGEGDALRSRLAPGRCLGVLAVAQFVRSLTEDRGWSDPGLRAAFVIDDPNLRRPTYGHINYPEMAASARALDYHVSIAMVPLDGRSFHSKTVRLFREDARHLSLCIHGNDHLRDELRRPRSLAEGRIPAAQAILRSVAFERRTGLTIDRVMVAPHERLGEATTAALFACGFDGFSGTRPYPWLDYAHDLRWLSRPADSGPLIGWQSAEVIEAGLLALLRIDFSHPREELIIRAFLGQPLIMYGHDDLLRGGPGELERAASEIGRLGDVQWQSLGGIARSSVASRRRGSTLEVRMFGRHVAFDVPPGVTDVLVSNDASESKRGQVTISGPVDRGPGETAPGQTHLAVRHPGRVEVALRHQLDPLTVPLPKASVRSIVRRLAAEGRDRTRSKLAWSPR